MNIFKKKYNKGDIFFAKDRKSVCIILNVNKDNLDVYLLHYSIGNHKTTIPFDVIKDDYNKVTKLEFEKGIRDWKFELTQKHNQTMVDITEYENNVLNYLDNSQNLT